MIENNKISKDASLFSGVNSEKSILSKKIEPIIILKKKKSTNYVWVFYEKLYLQENIKELPNSLLSFDKDSSNYLIKIGRKNNTYFDYININHDELYNIINLLVNLHKTHSIYYVSSEFI